MEAMIENGEAWMEPLLDFRNRLAETQDPSIKRQVRQFKRRNGKVTFTADGKVIPGPYTPDFRKQLLRELLTVQSQVIASGELDELISKQELEEIRRIWRSEEQDWEDSVPKIFREAMSYDLSWTADETPVFGEEDRKTLDLICAQVGVPGAMVAKLLDVEKDFHAMSRRSAVHQRIAAVLEEDWRTKDQIASTETGDIDDPE